MEVYQTMNYQDTMTKAKTILETYLKKNPNGLVAVVCRYKGDADRVFDDLTAHGVPGLRRHERDDFSFKPGIVVIVLKGRVRRKRGYTGIHMSVEMRRYDE